MNLAIYRQVQVWGGVIGTAVLALRYLRFLDYSTSRVAAYRKVLKQTVIIHLPLLGNLEDLLTIQFFCGKVERLILIRQYDMGSNFLVHMESCFLVQVGTACSSRWGPGFASPGGVLIVGVD